MFLLLLLTRRYASILSKPICLDNTVHLLSDPPPVVTFVFACLAIKLWPTQMTIWAFVVALVIALVSTSTSISASSYRSTAGVPSSNRHVLALAVISLKTLTHYTL